MGNNDKTLPEQISDALRDIEEHTGVNVQKTTAKIARNAYVLATLGLTIPLTVSGPPSLSQEQVRRPEEHLPGISEDHDAVLEAGNAIEAEMVSVFQVSASDSVQVSVEETGDIAETL